MDCILADVSAVGNDSEGVASPGQMHFLDFRDKNISIKHESLSVGYLHLLLFAFSKASHACWCFFSTLNPAPGQAQREHGKIC